MNPESFLWFISLVYTKGVKHSIQEISGRFNTFGYKKQWTKQWLQLVFGTCSFIPPRFTNIDDFVQFILRNRMGFIFYCEFQYQDKWLYLWGLPACWSWLLGPSHVIKSKECGIYHKYCLEGLDRSKHEYNSGDSINRMYLLKYNAWHPCSTGRKWIHVGNWQHGPSIKYALCLNPKRSRSPGSILRCLKALLMSILNRRADYPNCYGLPTILSTDG